MSDATLDTEAPTPKEPPRWRAVLAADRKAQVGLVIVAIFLFGAIFAPWIAPYDPNEMTIDMMGNPSWEHPLGTDDLGRDLLSRILWGTQISLCVGVATVGIALFFGVLLGVLAGYYGGWIDTLLMRFTEVFQVLPALLFAMVIVALFEPSTRTVAIAIGLASWPGTARLTRAEFLRLKNLEFVKAARAVGASDFRIIWRVIFPNALPPLIVSITLIMGRRDPVRVGAGVPRAR